ncbi:hypothetical protein I4U23_000022 [Adineta vaga]|nr:hypothetical protein I4U23_000022 [Adineta vaga]
MTSQTVTGKATFRELPRPEIVNVRAPPELLLPFVATVKSLFPESFSFATKALTDKRPKDYQRSRSNKALGNH